MFHAVEAGRLVARSNACRRPTGTDLIKRPDLPRTNQRLPVAATRARRGRDTARVGASPNLVDRSRLHTPFIDDDRVIDKDHNNVTIIDVNAHFDKSVFQTMETLELELDGLY